jgi:5-methylcytosine-specific restriction endonuclease McrA
MRTVEQRARNAALKRVEYAKKRGAILERNRAWRRANPGKVRQYRDRTREARLKQQRQWEASNKERRRAYRVANRERRNEQSRLSMARAYAFDPERIKANVDRWRRANLDKVNTIHERRRARLMGLSIHHTTEEWLALLGRIGGKCAHCGTTERISRDHINPLSKGGSDTIDNIQPLCRSCNSRKGAKGRI